MSIFVCWKILLVVATVTQTGLDKVVLSGDFSM